jgi:hypothetical protein
MYGHPSGWPLFLYLAGITGNGGYYDGFKVHHGRYGGGISHAGDLAGTCRYHNEYTWFGRTEIDNTGQKWQGQDEQ